MAKKLLCVWLSFTIVFFSSISIYADENVRGDFFAKNIVINGEKINNYNLQYPFFLYGSTTYFPLSPEMGEICGITAEMDWESRTLKLLKTDSTRKNISSNWLKNNNVDLTVEVLSGVEVLVYEKTAGENVEEITGEIAMPELSVREMDLGGMPILAKGKYIFLPVKAFVTDKTFQWDTYFDPYYGICISTNKASLAKAYCDNGELLHNKGLVAYMRNYNKNLTVAKAQELVFLFHRASDVYKIDEKLLMAVAHKESTFTASAHARGGAIGIMQIMPSTGARFGLTEEQLYDAKTNIDFGAMYISQRIAAYNGDRVKGLSAYNQGSSKVNRGTHSTSYATKILAAYSGLDKFLRVNGYVGQ